MAFYKVPINNNSLLYSSLTTLDLTKLNLTIRYNGRNDCWYMSVTDVNNVTLVDGVPLLTNVIEMIKMFRVLPDAMSGDFIVWDNQTGTLDCTKDNLGSITQLFYVNDV